MLRKLTPFVLVLPLVLGCAGPTKLAERSEEKLAGGQAWRAWGLATRALDKDPGNARARAAAAAAAGAIADEWQRRIHAQAGADSVAAAEQVLEFATFRASAVRYAVVPASPEWMREEQTLRRTAARLNYQRGAADLESRRPKRAYQHFNDVERFSPGYRDAAALAVRAYQRALTRVAFVPLVASPGNLELGRDVAARWRDDLAGQLAAPSAYFTRILGSEAIEQLMPASQLGRVSRDQAVNLGRKAGADRVVWGSIGDVHADTRIRLFTDVIARRNVTTDRDGNEMTTWSAVPIEVVARIRTVTVDYEYEVIATRGGVTLAHRHDQRSSSARVVWTSYAPEGNLDAYALVSDIARAADPDRATRIEASWRSVCGESTTLRQVLEARRSTRGPAHYQRDVLPRIIAGAAFVFLEDLPPAQDLAFAALVTGSEPLHQDLMRLDGVDDVDLGVAMNTPDEP
jgi:hypothetical protein